MGTSQWISFCLDGHKNNLMGHLHKQWLEESFCDLQLCTLSGTLLVHCCVVLPFCPSIAFAVRDKRKNGRKRTPNQTSNYSINVEFEYDVVKCIMEAIYCGVVSVDVGVLEELSQAAEWFGMKELTAVIERFTKKLKDHAQGNDDVASKPQEGNIRKSSRLHKKKLFRAKKSSNRSTDYILSLISDDHSYITDQVQSDINQNEGEHPERKSIADHSRSLHSSSNPILKCDNAQVPCATENQLEETGGSDRLKTTASEANNDENNHSNENGISLTTPSRKKEKKVKKDDKEVIVKEPEFSTNNDKVSSPTKSANKKKHKTDKHVVKVKEKECLKGPDSSEVSKSNSVQTSTCQKREKIKTKSCEKKSKCSSESVEKSSTKSSEVINESLNAEDDDANMTHLQSLLNLDKSSDPAKIVVQLGSCEMDLNLVKTEDVEDDSCYPGYVPELAITTTDLDIVKQEIYHDETVDRLKCVKCYMVFTDPDEYQNHIKDHPIYKCETCYREFFSRPNFVRHMRQIHMKLKHLKCSNCEFQTDKTSLFSEHCLNVHQETRPFKCLFEGCTFNTNKYRRLSSHFQRHEQFSFRNTTCDKCGKSFPDAHLLRSHKKSCYHLQSYLCDICGQAFNFQQSMTSHKRTMHFGEKPFPCTVCKKSFTCHANLRRHCRIHNNAYPYLCSICGQNFRHSNMLKIHMKKHPRQDDTDMSQVKSSWQQVCQSEGQETVTSTTNENNLSQSRNHQVIGPDSKGFPQQSADKNQPQPVFDQTVLSTLNLPAEMDSSLASLTDVSVSMVYDPATHSFTLPTSNCHQENSF